jgi:hypothetical protein
MAGDAKGRSTGELSEIREVSRPGTWPDGAGSADLLDHERCEGHGAGNHQNAQREVVRCGHFERGYERGCLVRERRLEHFNDGLAAVEVIDRREVAQLVISRKHMALGFYRVMKSVDCQHFARSPIERTHGAEANGPRI